MLPRSRAIPKPKPLTKWQEFAKAKGISPKKKNKTKVKWDDELQVDAVLSIKPFFLISLELINS